MPASPTEIVDVTLTTDTSQYASGDVIADTQVVSNAFGFSYTGGILQTVTIVDSDDQGAALYIYLMDGSGSMGTENSGPSISDGNAGNVMGIITVATTDYQDVGGAKVGFLSNLAIPIHAAAGTRDFYVAVVNGTGTPTYSATGIKLRFGILRDQRSS